VSQEVINAITAKTGQVLIAEKTKLPMHEVYCGARRRTLYVPRSVSGGGEKKHQRGIEGEKWERIRGKKGQRGKGGGSTPVETALHGANTQQQQNIKGWENLQKRGRHGGD